MMPFHRSHRRYRPKLFPWFSGDDIGSAAVLAVLMWLAIVALPAVAPDLRQLLIDIGFTIGTR